MTRSPSPPSVPTIQWLEFYPEKPVYHIGEVVKIIGEFQSSTQGFPVEITLTFPDGKKELQDEVKTGRTRNVKNNLTCNYQVNLSDSKDYPLGKYTVSGQVNSGKCTPPSRTTSFQVQ